MYHISEWKQSLIYSCQPNHSPKKCRWLGWCDGKCKRQGWWWSRDAWAIWDCWWRGLPMPIGCTSACKSRRQPYTRTELWVQDVEIFWWNVCDVVQRLLGTVDSKEPLRCCCCGVLMRRWWDHPSGDCFTLNNCHVPHRPLLFQAIWFSDWH